MKKLLLLSLVAIAAVQAKTTTDAPVRLLGSDEVDCKRVKGYSAQKACMEEQAKAKAEQQAIENLKDASDKRYGDKMYVQRDEAPVPRLNVKGLTCERHHGRVEDHKTITITDASQDFRDNKIFLTLKVRNNYREQDVPRSYVGNMLPQTFIAQMRKGPNQRLTNGEWRGNDVRVYGEKEYQVLFVLDDEGFWIRDILCLN